MDTQELTENNWIEYNQEANKSPDKEVFLKLKTIKQFIPKKNAAFEVLKWVKKAKIMSYALIGGVFVTAVGGALNVYGGAIPAGILTILAALSIKKSMETEKYFEEEYNIDIKSK